MRKMKFSKMFEEIYVNSLDEDSLKKQSLVFTRVKKSNSHVHNEK